MTTTTDWASLMTTIGGEFAKRSAHHDQDDSFVAENYATLREHGAFAAGVPAELGGGLDGALNLVDGGVVAPHGVDGDLHHGARVGPNLTSQDSSSIFLTSLPL